MAGLGASGRAFGVACVCVRALTGLFVGKSALARVFVAGVQWPLVAAPMPQLASSRHVCSAHGFRRLSGSPVLRCVAVLACGFGQLCGRLQSVGILAFALAIVIARWEQQLCWCWRGVCFTIIRVCMRSVVALLRRASALSLWLSACLLMRCRLGLGLLRRRHIRHTYVLSVGWPCTRLVGPGAGPRPSRTHFVQPLRP